LTVNKTVEIFLFAAYIKNSVFCNVTPSLLKMIE